MKEMKEILQVLLYRTDICFFIMLLVGPQVEKIAQIRDITKIRVTYSQGKAKGKGSMSSYSDCCMTTV
jgi:hypothetical protein